MNQTADNTLADAAAAAEAMTSPEQIITAGGRQHTVRRLEMRQIWPILRAGLPIFSGLVGLLGTAPAAAAGTPQDSGAVAGQATKQDPLQKILGNEVASFLTLCAEHGERVTEITAIALDITVSDAGKFEPQEGYLAIKAIIAVNQDFFSRQVAPILGIGEGTTMKQAAAKIGVISESAKEAVSSMVGQTPSNS